MTKKWVITGISGSGRIELLNDIKAEAEGRNVKVLVHDVGDLIRRQAVRHRMKIVDKRILDIDQSQLRLLRNAALQTVKMEIMQRSDIDHHFIGVHATFRWKGRLIQGISYTDILDLKPDAMVNVVRNVKEIIEINKANPKWDSNTLPDPDETQDWMIEEEFVTEMLAEVIDMPMYLIAHKHSIGNLADLFFAEKKRIYLSYPITAVKHEQPELLAQITGPILAELEELFVVFNPLAIEDMAYAAGPNLPNEVNELTERGKQLIEERTVERDFQFIDQSDAVVVFYLTDKLSPGVMAEIFYAHRNQIPVYMVFAGRVSPFLRTPTTHIAQSIDQLMEVLRKFSRIE